MMIQSGSIKEKGHPYLTRLSDEKGHSVTVDSSVSESTYLSPSQLLPAAMAGCMSMTIKGALFRAGLSYREVSVAVEMDVCDGSTVFTYAPTVDSDEDPELLAPVVRAACEACYVRGILSSEITVRPEKQ